MIIKAIKETLGVFTREPATSVNWPKTTEEKIECAIDDNIVECAEMNNPPYTGIPAPAVLPDDEWFGPSPTHTEKQEEYIRQQEATERLHQDIGFQNPTSVCQYKVRHSFYCQLHQKYQKEFAQVLPLFQQKDQSVPLCLSLFFF